MSRVITPRSWTTSVSAALAARRAAVRNDLTSDERTALEGVRDRLAAALRSIRIALGEETATDAAALYRASYGRPRNELDDEQRQALESARDDVAAALADVHTLLGETDAAARLKAVRPNPVTALYAQRNTTRQKELRR
jgi:hypothetical protein